MAYVMNLIERVEKTYLNDYTTVLLFPIGDELFCQRCPCVACLFGRSPLIVVVLWRSKMRETSTVSNLKKQMVKNPILNRSSHCNLNVYGSQT